MRCDDGFTARNLEIQYDLLTTFGSLAVAVAVGLVGLVGLVVGLGVFLGLFVSRDPVMEREGKWEWGTRPGEGSGEKLEWTPVER